MARCCAPKYHRMPMPNWHRMISRKSQAFIVNQSPPRRKAKALPYDATGKLIAHARGGVTTSRTKQKRPAGQQEAAPTGRSRPQSRRLVTYQLATFRGSQRRIQVPPSMGLEQDVVDLFQVDGLDAVAHGF